MTPRPTQSGGTVTAVEPGPAQRAGLRPGDRVVAVDGAPVRDVIDWLWLTEEPAFTVTVERQDGRVTLPVERTSAEALGVSFSEALFTPVRECENACAFCFVAQLPPGLRPSLYVRDDDYRLSFLSGNFITLTNMESEDVERVMEQRLTPLHVSVHAVDPGVRARLLCPTVEDRALEVLDTLLAGGIDVHVQIVLVPGVNDGAVLEQTLTYLAERAGVLSVGAVPMGITRYQRRFSSSFDRSGAERVVDAVSAWQARMRTARGAGWVYAADEFHLLAGLPLPLAADYDDFPQYENGIGMASAFADEFRVEAGSPHLPATVVTGTLFEPVLRGLLETAGWGDVRVLGVANDLFGGNVDVTGLLGGRDIAAAITRDGGAGTYLVPDVVVNSDGLLLDDVPAGDLARESRADVRIVGSDATSLIDALTGA